ncbi:MAG: helix-turn-helix transcriptional regulator [Nitrospinae bacterium]|nr:helix-turn-helix transcriptional regulator [Nitrospinota bacterium]
MASSHGKLGSSVYERVWRMAMEMNSATSVGETLDIVRKDCGQIVPFDVFMFLRMPGSGAGIPENPSGHNASFLDNFWLDYREGGFYEDDPAVAVFTKPGVKNVPFRANSAPKFYETPICRELLKKYHINVYMAMRMEFAAEKRVLGLGQLAGSRAYTQKDEDILALIGPHLSRSIEYCELLEKSRPESATTPLEQGQAAVWRFSLDMEITETNAPAERLMTRWKEGGISHEAGGRSVSLPRDVIGLLMTARNMWMAEQRSGSSLLHAPASRITVNAVREVYDFQAAVTRPINGASGVSITLVAERGQCDRNLVINRVCNLTLREKEVVMMAREGRSNRDISEMLTVCEQTVKQHMSSALRKTGARNRTELIHKLYGPEPH